MSIAPPTGAMSAYLARLVSSAHLPLAARRRQAARPAAAQILLRQGHSSAEEFARGFWTGGTLFEELGFYYVGPIDGHDLDHLLPVLKNVRDGRRRPDPGPCRDQEGQGLCARRSRRRQVSRRRQLRRHHRRAGQAQGQRARLHQGVRREPDRRGAGATRRSSPITAAMPSGTGLDLFGKRVPRRAPSTSASPSSTP